MSGTETPAPRGEAAWKAHLARVAARNAEASAIGRQQRQERERLEKVRHSDQERRMDAGLSRPSKRDR
jgi:hypothetical protein